MFLCLPQTSLVWGGGVVLLLLLLLLSCSDLQAAFDVLKDAAFPKKLRWRRLIDLSEDLTIQVPTHLLVAASQASGRAKLAWFTTCHNSSPLHQNCATNHAGYCCCCVGWIDGSWGACSCLVLPKQYLDVCLTGLPSLVRLLFVTRYASPACLMGSSTALPNPFVEVLFH